MSENQKATVFAIVEESTAGTLQAPASGGAFIPLRSGFGVSPGLEELENDEIKNSIGRSKPLTGKENPSGSHPAYLKHSEVEGQAPEYSLLLKSALGAETTIASERDTVGGSTAGTAAARATLVMDAGEGTEFPVGRAVLIKDGTNGYSIRNVFSVATDTLSLNFNLGTAPASGVNTGKPTTLSPTSTGHASFSAWTYNANGGAVQAVSGAKVSSVSLELPAAQQATAEFSYEGTKYYFNPVEVTASNNKIDFTDDGGTVAATLSNKFYKDPIDYADEVATKMTAASVGSGDDAITCTYDSLTGKFTIATDGSTLSLLWNSGANTANNAEAELGFDNVDETAATTYTSDSAMSLAAPYTASFDDADNIVVKNSEFMIGDFSENFCRDVSSVSFSIDNSTVDVDNICEESGLEEKLINAREATLSGSLIVTRYEVGLFHKFIKNNSAGIMFNTGPKDGSGNWIPGKCVNVCFPNASITGHEVAGDDAIIVEVSASAFVTTNEKDVYINFL